MSSEPPEVQGRCEPAFESLRRALAEVMDVGFEVGAARAVHVGRQPVVDLWAGHQDSARTRPWGEHTIVNLYSVGKAVTELFAHSGSWREAHSISIHPHRGTGPSSLRAGRSISPFAIS